MTGRAQFLAGGLLCAQSAVVLAQVETTCTAGHLDEDFGTAATGYVQFSPALSPAGNILSGLGSESAVHAAVSELAAACTPMQQNGRE
jgi:hypothetical protein